MRKNLARRVGIPAACAALAMMSLAACGGSADSKTDEAAPSGAEDTTASDSGEASADNPFGVKDDSSVEAVIFDGGYGIEYVAKAGETMMQNFPTVKVEVHPSSEIGKELQPRFVSGNPPDLFTNDGAGNIPLNTILDELTLLDDVWTTENLDGVKIEDAVFPGVKMDGTYDEKFVYANYVMTVFGLWFSNSLLEEHGWEVPKTWDEMLDLGEKAKAEGLYLFTFGKEAADYYQWMALDSAIKQGGIEVMEKIANLEPDAWKQPVVVDTVTKLQEIVDKGYIMPGGAGTAFTQAQAQWSNDQAALFYPTASWIENEMADATAENFQMVMAPFPTLTTDSAMPYEAVQAGAGVPFAIPSTAANVDGGKELLRTMLSKEAGSEFSRLTHAPSVVKGTVPEDGFGSTALASTMKALEAADENTFNWVLANKGNDYYGLGHAVEWAAFLSGDLSAEEMLDQFQEMADRVASDDSIEKIKFTF